MNFLSEVLNEKHARENFSCGKDVLDRYLKVQANQDIRRMLSVCFVYVDHDYAVKAYYTLSSSSIPSDSLPGYMKKKIPPGYNTVPVILLGRLAVDLKYQGQHLGADLLLDAMKRSLSASLVVGSCAMIVDPIDDEAKAFYLKFGFEQLANGKMFIPMKDIAAVL
jgi:ribosomal protein S18 acetylase RimI-like enzyme